MRGGIRETPQEPAKVDTSALVDELRGLLIDWDGTKLYDASLPRIDVTCQTIRRAADEIEVLREALQKIKYLRPAGPSRNKLIEQMERIAMDALERSGR